MPRGVSKNLQHMQPLSGENGSTQQSQGGYVVCGRFKPGYAAVSARRLWDRFEPDYAAADGEGSHLQTKGALEEANPAANKTMSHSVAFSTSGMVCMQISLRHFSGFLRAIGKLFETTIITIAMFVAGERSEVFQSKRLWVKMSGLGVYSQAVMRRLCGKGFTRRRLCGGYVVYSQAVMWRLCGLGSTRRRGRSQRPCGCVHELPPSLVPCRLQISSRFNGRWPRHNVRRQSQDYSHNHLLKASPSSLRGSSSLTEMAVGGKPSRSSALAQ